MTNYTKIWWMAATMLTACSSGEPDYIDGGVITLGAQVDVTMAAQSRAETVASLMPETIGVFAEYEGGTKRVFDNQIMYYEFGNAVKTTGIDIDTWPTDNLWPYTPTQSWIGGKTYRFYAYAPYDAQNAELVQSGVNTNTFRFHNIPPLSATEYMVGKKEVSVSAGTRPQISFTHITSRLRFCFAIGEQYDLLRKIRITSIKISDSGSGTPYWECQIELQGDTPEIQVEKSSDIYINNADIELLPEKESSDGMLLDREYTSFSSAYNLLGQIANTVLTVTYDVYDKQDQLLRKDQIATNTVDLSKWTFERGKCYDVKILVSPKYLYVLSDNDVPPTAVLDVNDPTL